MIFIRADANEQIGTGHIMRCLSIAHILSEMEEVIFITADHKADRLINSFKTICLDTNWMDMEAEVLFLRKAIMKFTPSLLLIDSYYVTESYFNSLSREVKTVYIDDLNTTCWDVDYLINYNIFAKELDYSAYKRKNKKLLLTPEYAPLRNEFLNLPQNTINLDVANIFVSAGGADPECITEKIIKTVCSSIEDVTFHFIIGQLNPRIEKIKQLSRDNIVLHINERHMSDLMRKCDIAVAAAGSTLYELCACGIPTITYTLADNQIIAAETFNKDNIMINAGDCRNNNEFIDILKAKIYQLMSNYDKRVKLSEMMQNLVDGKGAIRIAKELLK